MPARSRITSAISSSLVRSLRSSSIAAIDVYSRVRTLFYHAPFCNAGLAYHPGKNVRRLREQRRLTQEQLAFEAEIDLTYMGGIERGRRNPSLLVMARIADALSVPLPKLLSE
jgi:DNA-binding XRE family transcriptional regulator